MFNKFINCVPHSILEDMLLPSDILLTAGQDLEICKLARVCREYCC